jgi:hypothetical protein
MRSSSFKPDGLRWEFAERWRGLATEISSLPWNDVGRLPGAHPLKVSRSRSVWHLQVAGRPIVAKIYRPSRSWERLKWLLLGPPGRHEFETAVRAASRTLDVIRPVACGCGPRGTHVFISEAVPDAAALSVRWLETGGAEGGLQRRRALIAETARLVRGLHAAGLRPSDLHPENILVQRTPDGPRAVLVDLHRARWCRTVSTKHREANLAELCQWFRRHASGADLLRFWRSYVGPDAWKASGMQPESLRRLWRRVARRARRLARKRDRRIYGDNAYVGRIRLPGGWRGFVLLRGPRAGNGSVLDRQTFSKSQWLEALPGLLDAAAQPIPSSPATVALGNLQVAVTCRRALGAVKDFRSRWEQAHSRLNRVEPTPLPLALLERTAPHGRKESILIMESAP